MKKGLPPPASKVVPKLLVHAALEQLIRLPLAERAEPQAVGLPPPLDAAERALELRIARPGRCASASSTGPRAASREGRDHLDGRVIGPLDVAEAITSGRLPRAC